MIEIEWHEEKLRRMGYKYAVFIDPLDEPVTIDWLKEKGYWKYWFLKTERGVDDVIDKLIMILARSPHIFNIVILDLIRGQAKVI